MADENVNQWFKNADLSMTAMAHMLIELDRRGHLEEGMQEALRSHALNVADITVTEIQGTAKAAASALMGDGGLGDLDAAFTFSCIASQAEKLHAMQELHVYFRDYSKPAGKPKTRQ